MVHGRTRVIEVNADVVSKSKAFLAGIPTPHKIMLNLEIYTTCSRQSRSPDQTFFVNEGYRLFAKSQVLSAVRAVGVLFRL